MRILALVSLITLAGCTCERLPPGGGSAIATPAARDLGGSGRLGGGYMGARWGDRRAEVKRRLVTKIASETPDAIVLAVGAATVTLRFDAHDTLVGATYSPAPNATDPAPLVAAMVQKFGAPTSTPPDASVDARRWIWNDGETEVAVDSHHLDGKVLTEVRYEWIKNAPMQGNAGSRH